ncbi:MAG: CinA family protein [Janthinobacterium lividum]
MDDRYMLCQVTDYLKTNALLLSTAESCTAGQMIALLASIPGSGQLLESGYVVYSPEAKQRILHVSGKTIEVYGLTSEEVAIEMAEGALKGGPANVAVATTGVAGPDAMDGIDPGTVCMAWLFTRGDHVAVFTQTEHFAGDRYQVQLGASLYALDKIPVFHRMAVNGEMAAPIGSQRQRSAAPFVFSSGRLWRKK